MEKRITDGRIARDRTIIAARNKTANNRSPKKYQVGDSVLLQIDTKTDWIPRCKIVELTDKEHSYWVETPSGSCLLRNEQFIRQRDYDPPPTHNSITLESNVNSYFS